MHNFIYFNLPTNFYKIITILIRLISINYHKHGRQKPMVNHIIKINDDQTTPIRIENVQTKGTIPKVNPHSVKRFYQKFT
jgi:hypothetical protein